MENSEIKSLEDKLLSFNTYRVKIKNEYENQQKVRHWKIEVFLYDDWVSHRDNIKYKAKAPTIEEAMTKVIKKLQYGKYTEESKFYG